MAYNGLNWQVMNLPLAAGLQQRTDDRARPQPYLDICRDVQFDEIGGTQTRLPYLAMSNTIFGGGTLSNCRRLAVVNGELCLFTSDTLYSWNAQLSAWVSRSTHLAVTVDEAPVFVTTGDQLDGDRAELNGTVVYAWSEGGIVFTAAIDKATGSVLTSPFSQIASSTRPRLVALATKILMFFEVGTALKVLAIDPASPATALSGGPLVTVLAAGTFSLYYDVVRAGTQDLVVGACRRVTTTSYTAFTVTPALAVATSTKARTADGPLAVATIANGTQTQVIRGNGTNIQGDLLTTSTLADVFTGQAIGTVSATPVNQIAAAFASTTCTAFWSSQETSDSGNAQFATKSNTVTTGNVVGTQAVFVRRIGVGSRAFPYNGQVYVWLVFGEDSGAVVLGTPLGVRAQLQNTYFLYRSDGLLVSKATWQVAGGYSPSIGHLPGVAAVGATDYAWCGAARRVIAIGTTDTDRTAFGARSPRDITFSFDSNRARRCAQLGRTLYVTGGLLQQYDGISLVELGTQVYPWSIAAQDSGVAGNVAIGTYNWKGTIRYVNAQGEQERSTTATGVQVAVAGAPHIVLVSYFPLYVTNKTARVPSLEFWRTAVAAAPGAPYYLITGQDPSVTAGDNPYIPNAPSGTGGVFNDNFSDTTLTSKESNPENDGVLEDLAPPGAASIIATDTRLFLSGVPGDPHRIWPSKERQDGGVASFHDALPVAVPSIGGDITAVFFQDETLYVGRETALFAFPGRGLDNAGGGSGYGPARPVSLDIGVVSQESVVLTPHGTLFQSRKGWQLLDRSGSALLYVGGAIFDFETETVLATSIVEAQYQVRILTDQRVILWAYPREGAPGGTYPQEMAAGGQWGEWTIGDGVHACMWQGQHVILTATGPKIQQASYSSLTYGLDVEETWIKVADLQGAVRVRKIQPLGEYRSAFLLRLRLAYNYDPTYVDDVVWSPTPTVVGGALQLKHGPKRPVCEAFKIRITAVTDAARAQLATASMSPTVPTSGVVWTATWRAADALPGESGNALTMTVAAIAFSAVAARGLPREMPFEFISETGAVTVNDNATWSPTTSSWVAAPGNIGVLVAGSLTVADLEAAIAEATTLATLVTPDATPAKTVDTATLVALAQAASGTFSGGVYGAPTGEALKLTGLALEVGVEGGVFRRLAAGQAA